MADRIRRGEKTRVPRLNGGADPKETTHICVADEAGNCVTMTHSLGSSSGFVTEGLGFMYNNCMMVFDPRPGRAGSLAPGKARFTAMSPTIVFRGDEPFFLVGAPGGTTITMGNLQAILNAVDFGMDAQEAVSAPRFTATSDTIELTNRILRAHRARAAGARLPDQAPRIQLHEPERARDPHRRRPARRRRRPVRRRHGGRRRAGLTGAQRASGPAARRPARNPAAFLSGAGNGGGAFPFSVQAVRNRRQAEAFPLQNSPEQKAIKTELSINGARHALELDPRTTLLDALRHHLGLTGTKKGCDHGQCGACTILVNGRRINACLTLACMHEGDEITTIEGLGEPAKLSALQQAFVSHDGYQCGYCTPGQICSATAMLVEVVEGWPSHVTDDLSGTPQLTHDEIAERMSGNLCRCAAYPNIVAAILDAAGQEGSGAA